jgi:predicted aspartyl protease
VITGHVNAVLEAVLSIETWGPGGDGRMLEAIIDTGFDGYLTLPRDLMDELNLPFVEA